MSSNISNQVQNMDQKAQGVLRNKDSKNLSTSQDKSSSNPGASSAFSSANGQSDNGPENIDEAVNNLGQKKEQATGFIQNKLQSKKEEWNQTLNEQSDRFQNQQKMRQYAREKFSQENVDDIVDRLKTVLGEVQGNSEYQDAINTIFRLFEKWGQQAGGAAESSGSMVAQTTQEYRSDPNLSVANAEIKTIIEDWAQGRSLDPLIRGIDTIVQDVKNDNSLRQCYDQAVQYIQRLLKEPGYATDDQSTEDGKYLVNHIRELTSENYRGHMDFMMNEAKAYIHTMEEDPMAREIEMRLKQIHNDLWLDA